MIIALFALSLAMIVGGIAAVVQGFPFVRLESGLAMVIAGATTASAGAVLLGLAAVAARLKRVEEALGEFRDVRGDDLPVSVPTHREAGSTRVDAPRHDPVLADVSPATQHPGIAGTAGLAGLTVGGAAPAADRRPSEPIFEDAEPPRQSREQASQAELLPIAAEDERAPSASPIGAGESQDAGETAGPVPLVAQEDDLFATHELEATPGHDTAGLNDEMALRPSLDETTPPVAPAATTASAAETPTEPDANAGPMPEGEPQVVGTYASGGNTYVMFSNGSIEADTPRGRFRFGSLDELKAFVDAGGESGERGAA